jgi:hypothetical protein
MSHNRGKGHVQVGIRRAFIVDPDRAWSTTALMEWAFPLQLYRGRTASRHRMNYSRSIRRAAGEMCEKVERKGRGRPWLWRLRKPVP